MTKYFFTAFIFLSSIQIMISGIYPDEIRGWKRIDSTTIFESTIKNVIGNNADIAFEYGIKKIIRGQYQLNDEKISVDAYEFSSTLGAHGFLSTRCGEKDFFGAMGNASLFTDTTADFAMGSFYVEFKSDSAGITKKPPANFIYGVYDIIAKISDNEIVRTALPMDERKVGSERYYVAPHSWSTLTSTSLKPLLPILQQTHAFLARYVKERLGIVRILVSFVESSEEEKKKIITSFENFFSAQSLKQMKHKKIEEYPWNNMKYYIVNSRKGLFLSVANQDDTGAMQWLIDLFD